MKKTLIYLISFFVFLLPAAMSAKAVKPRPPVELSLQKTQIEKEKIRLLFSARANIQTKKLSLSMALPLGLSLLEGEPKWEGPLDRGESHRMSIFVQGTGGISDEVRGMAIIQLPKGGSFTQKIRLSLSPLKAEEIKPPPPILLQSGGEPVLEFRGRR